MRSQLLIVGLLWVLVALTCYGQTWLRLHLHGSVLLIDPAIFNLAFLPAIFITAAVSRRLWREKQQKPVAYLILTTGVERRLAT